MKYSPNLDAAIIPMDEINHVGNLLFIMLVEIRKAYDLPLDKYEREHGPLRREDHAQKTVIRIADFLGIELGANWGNEIDLRDYAT